jgi:uncharacterized membrane protein YidH (DUF202 family)
VVLGAIVAAESFRQWRGNDTAMRRRAALPRSRLPHILTFGIVAVGVLADLWIASQRPSHGL